MRVTADLFADGSSIPILDGAGAVCANLWTQAGTWACRDAPLEFRVYAPEAIALPEAEPTEPVVGALARLLQALRGTGAVLMLGNPATALGPQRILYAEGVRLFAISDPADEAAWDALLAHGQPVYGVRGLATLEVMRPTAQAVLSALSYGLFTADEGLTLSGLHEDRAGVVYVADRPTTATVIIRGGFEAGTLTGTAGEPVRYVDSGKEASVRLVIRDAAGNRCSTQPRFVVPQRHA
jgi:hypothetical protein